MDCSCSREQCRRPVSPSPGAFCDRMASASSRDVRSLLPVRFLEEDDPRVPGCLVLDIRMPEMTGLELQRALYVRGNKLPIIFLTGHGDIETAVYTMKYGAVDFFEKRGDPLKLRDSVSKACERSRQYWRQKKEEEKFEETFNSLTNREKDVIVLAAKGASNREIADQLGIGQETVKMHCSNAYGKLGVRSRSEAVCLRR